MTSPRKFALFLLATVTYPITGFTPSHTSSPQPFPTCLFSISHDVSAEEALARTEAHLKKLQQRQRRDAAPNDLHPQQKQSIQQETLYQDYIRQPANALKTELQKRKLNTKGRKPDLARRLAQHDMKTTEAVDDTVVVVEKGPLIDEEEEENDDEVDPSSIPYPVRFAGLPLSLAAATALHQAGFLNQPSPIQAAALPALAKGESVLLHAPTGSGKTIAYVLPITEYLWRFQQKQSDVEDFAVICTPTRELAAQVAGVASTLAPAGSVRLLSHPSNLMTDGSKDRKDKMSSNRGNPTIIVGSAKAIVHSLYGNEDFPAPPTPQPLALEFLKNVRVLVLDEVDRLVNVQGKHGEPNKKKKHEHEKPAAILTAAVARHTLGGAQIVAASATVGRPLKRELARILGLPPPKGPRVIVAHTTIAEEEAPAPVKKGGIPQGSSRLVTIPKNVEHYLASVTPKDEEDKTSSGQLLIKAFQVIQDTVKENNKARILLVLARGFGISTAHVIGALQHFNCDPPPVSLLDALQENALDGTDHLMQVHRQVSGATGVGQSSSSGEETSDDEGQQSSSLWVTGEDTIRGLHLDGLDVVLLVGRPRGPDEYTHIAGRTGRAGRKGKVVAVISGEQAPLLRGWETMLKMQWKEYGEKN